MKVLIANRGEIAARIIRTLNERGIESVAVYAAPDMNSLGVQLADEAYALGDGPLAATYLNGDKILEIAKESGATAIHPGYGFLSENPDFARACVEAGLTWIGPSAETITALGDKIGARQTAEASNVSPVPGTSEGLTTLDTLSEFASAHGFPFVAKRTDGGGGRGITVFRSHTDIDAFSQRVDPASLSAHFLEKFIETARHIETQAVRDRHGNFAVVSTRDCSVQRRNQKLVEEAPAPFISDEVQAKLTQWSKNLFDYTGYVGVGTVEFLLDTDDSLYFLEVNPRLQVEHTVTEEVTGLDLVALQLAIAQGDELPTIPEVRGHSIQIRITSEDPGADLIPTAGTITGLTFPYGHGIRVETGVQLGDTVSPDYDSMIAKLIVTAPDRETCLARCLRALKELRVEGIAHPTALLAGVIEHPDFHDLKVTTRWMEETYLPGIELPQPVSGSETSPEQRRTFIAEIDGKRHEITVPSDLFAAPVQQTKPTQPRRGAVRKEAAAQGFASQDGVITSPIPAIIVRIAVEPGQSVAEGDLLMVLESMKMEKYVHAPHSGTVTDIHVEVSDNIPGGTALLTLEEN